MSQTTAPLPSGVPGPALGTTAPTSSRRSRWRAELQSTPGRLRFVAALAALSALAFALLGGGGYLMWSNSMKSAQADTGQLVLVQRVQNDLMAADALASTAYLAGGLEDAASRTGYEQNVKDAAEQLAQVAAGNPQDADQVATVNAAMARYLDQMSLARGANNQQLLVGAAYLRGGGKVLRSEIVPTLDQLSALTRRQVDEDYNAANRATAVMFGGAGIALLGGGLAQLWLSRRSHRYLNLPAAAGSAAILLVAGLGVAALSAAARHAGDVGQHSYAATAALAEARTKAFDAKANEALGLIARGNGKSFEAVSAADLTVAQAALARAVAAGADTASQKALTAWASAHQKVRQADDAGKWPEAQQQAVGKQPGYSSDAFEAFDTQVKAALELQRSQTVQGLEAAGRWLPWLGAVSVLVGLLAAAGAWTGFAQRWEEYR